MAFFPFRRTLAEADLFMEQLRSQIEREGYGFAPVELKDTGDAIGFAGLKPLRAEVQSGSDGTGHQAEKSGLDIFAPDAVEIGWRFLPQYWHKGYASEAARAWLEFGFLALGLKEIVSLAVVANQPSLAVMARIGMSKFGEFDHPAVPDSHPQLIRHEAWKISREDWAEQQQKRRSKPEA